MSVETIKMGYVWLKSKWKWTQKTKLNQFSHTYIVLLCLSSLLVLHAMNCKIQRISFFVCFPSKHLNKFANSGFAQKKAAWYDQKRWNWMCAIKSKCLKQFKPLSSAPIIVSKSVCIIQTLQRKHCINIILFFLIFKIF